MKKAVLLVSLLIAFNCVFSQDFSCTDFQKMYVDAQNDFAKYKGKVHEVGGGIGGGEDIWNEYKINLRSADKVELVKGPWDSFYTLRYEYTKEVEPQKGLELLNNIIESIKSCYPLGCIVYKDEDFNPEEPFYMIGATKDVNVMENESEAAYPVIRLYLDYNDVKLEISGCEQEE